jgi:DNA-binding NarL/FixJ family response regulator
MIIDAHGLNETLYDTHPVAAIESIAVQVGNGSRRQFSQRAGDGSPVILIDHRVLDRDCLVRSLQACSSDVDICGVGSLDEWLAIGKGETPSAIVLTLHNRSVRDEYSCKLIRDICARMPGIPVVVVADTDELAQMMKALECGAQGFIPSSVGIEVASEAIRLARAGGVFLPASGVLAMCDVIESMICEKSGPNGMFTPREAEVVEELRRGKANKIIAYELKLCQSTVKVHIRNIMKKVGATNRTEVAYKLRELQRA